MIIIHYITNLLICKQNIFHVQYKSNVHNGKLSFGKGRVVSVSGDLSQFKGELYLTKARLSYGQVVLEGESC